MKDILNNLDDMKKKRDTISYEASIGCLVKEKDIDTSCCNEVNKITADTIGNYIAYRGKGMIKINNNTYCIKNENTFR